MESQQLGQIRGNGADHSGDSRQLCNGLQDGDEVRSRLGGGTCFSPIKSVAYIGSRNKWAIVGYC